MVIVYSMFTPTLITMILICAVSFLVDFDNFDALCILFLWAGCVVLFMCTGVLLELQYIFEHDSQFSTDPDNLW